MKERPILFSAPMVRALLAGTKLQTRRGFSARMEKLMRAAAAAGEVSHFMDEGGMQPNDLDYVRSFCPYGQPGDRLWVRESWAPNTGSAGGFLYRADHGGAASFNRFDLKTGVRTHCTSRWWPSIHMPRAASRLTLEITGVRVERLQDISEADILAEGVTVDRVARWCNTPWSSMPTLHHAWQVLWEQINGPGSWAANPWVWVIEFQRINKPETAH